MASSKDSSRPSKRPRSRQALGSLFASDALGSMGFGVFAMTNRLFRDQLHVLGLKRDSFDGDIDYISLRL